MEGVRVGYVRLLFLTYSRHAHHVCRLIRRYGRMTGRRYRWEPCPESLVCRWDGANKWLIPNPMARHCPGSRPIHVSVAICFRLRNETGMSDLFWLIDKHTDGIDVVGTYRGGREQGPSRRARLIALARPASATAIRRSSRPSCARSSSYSARNTGSSAVRPLRSTVSRLPAGSASMAPIPMHRPMRSPQPTATSACRRRVSSIARSAIALVDRPIWCWASGIC